MPSWATGATTWTISASGTLKPITLEAALHSNGLQHLVFRFINGKSANGHE